MFTIYKYELKKILSQRYFILGFIVLMCFMIAVNFTPLFTGAIVSRDERMKIDSKEIDGQLIKEMYESDNSQKYYDIKSFIVNCSRSNEYVPSLDGEIKDITNEVYSKRLETIEKEKKVSYLTDEECAYWKEKEEKIKTPFIYECCDAYTETMEIGYLVNFLSLILITISLSGIFADEKQSGADQILYATKSSKSKLYIAKILAGLTIGTSLVCIEFAVLFGSNLLIWGSNGANACIQLYIIECLYDLTMQEAILYLFVLLFFGAILYATFAMLLSRITNSRSATSAIMIIGMFLSMFNIPDKYRVLSQIWHYIPAGHIGNWQFWEYRLLTLFNIQLNDFEASVLLWTLSSIIFVLIGKLINKKYQVLGR